MADSCNSYFLKYGQAATVYFPLITAGSNAFKSASGVTASDCTVIKDGVSSGNPTNAPTEVGSTGIYGLTFTAAELQAARVQVVIKDAAIEDRLLLIETSLTVGKVDVDATAYSTNTSAVSAKGYGTGHGIYTLGGATSGCGVSAEGQGTGYGVCLDGASSSLLSNIFDQNEGTEPSGAISDSATILAILQYLKRRFFNRVTQTSGSQTVMKDNSVTTLTTMTCTSDGTTQVKGKSS